MVLKLLILYIIGSTFVLCNVVERYKPRIEENCFKCSSEQTANCVRVQTDENDETTQCTEGCVVFIDGNYTNSSTFFKICKFCGIFSK